MDELDVASEREQIERDALVAAIRRRPVAGLLPCGACHSCGEDVEPRRLFCDSDCAQDWERRRR